jgi:hypothetical protein
VMTTVVTRVSASARAKPADPNSRSFIATPPSAPAGKCTALCSNRARWREVGPPQLHRPPGARRARNIGPRARPQRVQAVQNGPQRGRARLGAKVAKASTHAALRHLAEGAPMHRFLLSRRRSGVRVPSLPLPKPLETAAFCFPGAACTPVSGAAGTTRGYQTGAVGSAVVMAVMMSARRAHAVSMHDAGTGRADRATARRPLRASHARVSTHSRAGRMRYGGGSPPRAGRRRATTSARWSRSTPSQLSGP